MVHLVKLLNVAGVPNVVINADEVIGVKDRSDIADPTSTVIIELRNRHERVGNTFDEVIDIINSGKTPAYDLDENGVVKGFRDLRYSTQQDKDRAQAVAERTAAVKAAVDKSVADIASAGFGADIASESVAESNEEAVSGDSSVKADSVSFGELQALKTAKKGKSV